MLQCRLDFYNTINEVVSGRVAIGGSIALKAQNDPTVPADYKAGDIDLCLASEEDLVIVHEYLMANGYHVTLDLPNPYMFTVRKQYKKDGEKHDFFVVPSIENLTVEVDNIKYTHPSIVWAARGFYAGVGSAKAYGQLVNSGMVQDLPQRKYKKRRLMFQRVIRFIKSLVR